MKYLILAIRNFQKKCKNSFANCQNASQITNCERLIRTLLNLIGTSYLCPNLVAKARAEKDL